LDAREMNEREKVTSVERREKKERGKREWQHAGCY
jgi:hypothetical protein